MHLIHYRSSSQPFFVTDLEAFFAALDALAIPTLTPDTVIPILDDPTAPLPWDQLTGNTLMVVHHERHADEHHLDGSKISIHADRAWPSVTAERVAERKYNIDAQQYYALSMEEKRTIPNYATFAGFISTYLTETSVAILNTVGWMGLTAPEVTSIAVNAYGDMDSLWPNSALNSSSVSYDQRFRNLVNLAQHRARKTQR